MPYKNLAQRRLYHNNYQKEYNKKPEVRLKRSIWERMYRNRPEVKERIKPRKKCN